MLRRKLSGISSDVPSLTHNVIIHGVSLLCTCSSLGMYPGNIPTERSLLTPLSTLFYSISIQYLIILVCTLNQMPLNSSHLVGMSGKVLRIANSSKAVITFNKDGRDETAILLGKSTFQYFLAPQAFIIICSSEALLVGKQTE